MQRSRSGGGSQRPRRRHAVDAEDAPGASRGGREAAVAHVREGGGGEGAGAAVSEPSEAPCRGVQDHPIPSFTVRPAPPPSLPWQAAGPSLAQRSRGLAAEQSFWKTAHCPLPPPSQRPHLGSGRSGGAPARSLVSRGGVAGRRHSGERRSRTVRAGAGEARVAAYGPVGSDVAVHVGGQWWSEIFWASSDTLE